MGSALLRGVTLLGRNTLVGSVDLLARHSSTLIVFVRLQSGCQLCLQLRLVLQQLTVLCFDVLDVLEVTVDEPEREEDADRDENTEDGEKDGLDVDRLTERAEDHLGQETCTHNYFLCFE
jgi:hypothetical protein